MSGFPVLPAPTGYLSAPSRQYYRSASSPTRQHFQQYVDILISQLTPATAVQALRFPTGPLKECLDTATTSEQTFAMQAALASSNVQEWLDELSEWPWPEGGRSAGFEEPTSNSCKRMSRGRARSISPSPSPIQAATPGAPVTPERQITRTEDSFRDNGEGGDGPWIGCLPAADVVRYGTRTAEILREIDDLDMEYLKRRVLHQHILPLSPPGTPSFGGSARRSVSAASSATFTRMDDLTAVVTALVLQALPLLAKLTRLLNTWHIRLLVLKKMPTLLDAIANAEAAIRSAWHAVRISSGRAGANGRSQSRGAADIAELREDEFLTMKSVVEQKVNKAAKIIDYMLDVLDGWEDTIPDRLIERIDLVERDYGEWVAVCQRRIRDFQYRQSVQDKPTPSVERAEASAAEDVSQQPIETTRSIKDTALEEQPMPTLQPKAPELMPAAIVVTEHMSSAGFRTPPNISPRSSNESLRSEPSLPSMHKHAPGDFSNTASPIVWAPSDSMTPSENRMASEVSTPEDIIRNATNNGAALGPPAVFDSIYALGQDTSPSSSPPNFRSSTRSIVTFNDMPTVTEIPSEESPTVSKAPTEASFILNDDDESELDLSIDMGSPDSRRLSITSEDDQLQQQISEILESIPAKIRLSSQPAPLNHLNPPDFKMPRKPKTTSDTVRSTSSMSSRSGTPSFLLAPAYARKPRQQRGKQEIKLYHLSRSTGEAPIKLFIRLVGENGERVMVRVGGGWADLSEYLKEYASHHSRRSKSGSESKIEVRDIPVTVTTSVAGSRMGSSPPSRPGSALESPVSMSPLYVRKTRRSVGEDNGRNPRTPLAAIAKTADTPSSGTSTQSRSSSRLSWTEEDSSLGMSGPRSKNIEMSEESKAWVESVKEKVRIASGERKPSSDYKDGKFGELNKVGGTKRLFRKG